MLPAKRVTKDKLSKFHRYRKTQHSNGVKLLRIWVPDPRAAGFAEEADRQARLLRGRAEEAEAMAFIEAAVEWPEE